MDTFTQQLRDWQLFYSTVALASVTLAGLLFVSLSFHREATRGHENERLMRLARGSFGDYLYVLMLGLVFLVPHQAPIGLAIALFVLGMSRGYGLIRQLVGSRGIGSGIKVASSALREIALPLLASSGLLVVGIEVIREEMVALYGLVLVVAALLTTASCNDRLILVEKDVEIG